MPKPAPPEIAAKMPAGWKLWWIEGQIIHSQGLQHNKEIPGPLWPGRQFRIGEIDPASGKTYDATISYWMGDYDFADGDRVSLVGHIPADSKQLGPASFLINHDSAAYCPVGLGLPHSWVVCGGNSKVGGLGMMKDAFIAGSGNGDLHSAIWKHITQSCKSKPGYIYPLYKEFVDWIVNTRPKGPNERSNTNEEVDF